MCEPWSSIRLFSAPASRTTLGWMISTQTSLLLRLRDPDDAEAWNRFARLYAPLLMFWVKKLGVEPNRADDLVQEIFLTLLDKLPALADRVPENFRGWLRTVAVNKCRDWFRRQNREIPSVSLQADALAMDDPAQLLTDEEYRTFVAQAALRMMRESFQETTWQACWQHIAASRPAKEVAAELGISENAVYLACGRVLQRLRKELSGLWDDP